VWLQLPWQRAANRSSVSVNCEEAWQSVFADQAATPDLAEAEIAPQWQSIKYGEVFFDSIGQTEKNSV
jgi:hypothetical protein